MAAMLTLFILVLALAAGLLVRRAGQDRRQTNARPADADTRAVLNRLRRQSVRVGRI